MTAYLLLPGAGGGCTLVLGPGGSRCLSRRVVRAVGDPGPTIARVSPRGTWPSPRPKDGVRLWSHASGGLHGTDWYSAAAGQLDRVGERDGAASPLDARRVVWRCRRDRGARRGRGSRWVRPVRAGDYSCTTSTRPDCVTSSNPKVIASSERLAVSAVGRTSRFGCWPAPTTDSFQLALQQRVARDGEGIEPDVLPGGHLIALAQPQLVADYLLTKAGGSHVARAGST